MSIEDGIENSFKNLLVEDRGHIRLITINRPKALNALNQETLVDLLEAFHDIEADRNIWCVILQGAGDKAFVAGADVKEMQGLTPTEAEELSQLGHHVCDLIGDIRVPVIAAVSGYALGGGCELALACDFIYASENAVFGLVETKLGLIPGFGGVARLTRRVGAARARELIFCAEHLPADKAFEYGLVNQICESQNILEKSLTCAEKILKTAPYANSLVKSLIKNGQDADLRQANAMEQKYFGLVFSSDDHAEGIEAFLDKRKPTFKGE